MDIKIHHIGIVVDDMKKSIQIFELIGFKKEGKMCEDFNQNNYLQMMKDCFNNRIELIEPMNEKSTVYRTNAGIHHIAVISDNEEELRKSIKDNKLGKIFMDKISAPLFRDKEISFVYLKNNCIFEIISQ